ncbi:hypothetical protein [Maribellus maritimus]|uniref:hypothetical protein n=1 Tax=Maribellus maritimus TaxID=2870838 RepID=UPI001EECE4EE|nr:hypothetical protein [Maribellus maritimus]MCG6191502.1 hypothetical protein [Maribellus maritimus]
MIQNNKRIVFSLLALIAFFSVSLYFFTWEMTVLLTASMAVFFFLFFKLNSILNVDTMPPNVFTDTRRNFEYLLLGSTKMWRNIDVNSYNQNGKNKILSFAFYKRSLYADSFILRRMFSYLRENGTVLITIDLDDEKHYSKETLSYADLRMLHPITLRIRKFKFERIMVKYPLIFYPVFSFGYLFNKLKNSLFYYSDWNKKTNDLDQNTDNVITLTHEKLISKIEQMTGFAKERGYNTKIACMVRSKESMYVFRELEDRLHIQHPGLEMIALESKKDFDELVSRPQQRSKEAYLSGASYKGALLSLYLAIGNADLLPFTTAV